MQMLVGNLKAGVTPPKATGKSQDEKVRLKKDGLSAGGNTTGICSSHLNCVNSQH